MEIDFSCMQCSGYLFRWNTGYYGCFAIVIDIMERIMRRVFNLVCVCIAITFISSCSTYEPIYKFRSYASNVSNLETSTYEVNINKNKDVDILVYGKWNNDFKMFIGYQSWFPSIAYAKSSIENGVLNGSWLDSCKSKVVIWKSEDKYFKNAYIEVKSAPDLFIP